METAKGAAMRLVKVMKGKKKEMKTAEEEERMAKICSMLQISLCACAS